MSCSAVHVHLHLKSTACFHQASTPFTLNRQPIKPIKLQYQTTTLHFSTPRIKWELCVFLKHVWLNIHLVTQMQHEKNPAAIMISIYSIDSEMHILRMLVLNN